MILKALLNCLALLVCFRVAQMSGQILTANADRARTILKEGIGSKDPDVRIQAVLAASMVGQNERVLAAVEHCLEDKDVQMRIAAVHTLADLKSPQSRSALEKTLKKDDVPEVAFAAAKALYALKDPVGEKALLDVYNGKIDTNSNFLRKQARSFKREFHSVQSAAMFAVNEGVGYVPVPGAGEGFSAMMGLLSDPDLSARASVLLLLAKEKDPQAAELTKRALTDQDWSVCASAAQLIARTAKTEFRELLVPLFEDKKEKVRFRAAGAYLHLYLNDDK